MQSIQPTGRSRSTHYNPNEPNETEVQYSYMFQYVTLPFGVPTARLRTVSGSGGVLDHVLMMVNGRCLIVRAEGNFALFDEVLNTLRVV